MAYYKGKLDRRRRNEKSHDDYECKIIENNFHKGCGKIEVRCGDLKCKFELKTFTYMCGNVSYGHLGEQWLAVEGACSLLTGQPL